MPLLPQAPERYLHSPRLFRTPAGVELVVVSWEPGGESVLRMPVGPNGEVSLDEAEVPTGASATTRLGIADEGVVAPGDRRELTATTGGAAAEIVHDGDLSEVWLARDGEPRILVFRARGIAAAPALVRGERGDYVAFHHDVREDTHTRDVAKWLALRLVTAAGEVLETSAPWVDRDRDREGVEQSFEFPTLTVGRDGAIAVFGRGSHNFYRQDIDAEGFGPRIALSDGEWGARGRQIAVCARDDGQIVTARRERKGVVVDVMEEPDGGPPAWVPADVDWTGGAAPRSYRARTRDEDPARASGLMTLFGDIQQHSAHSDGIGAACEPYVRARHHYHDDFCALTDHESFLGKRIGPGEWLYLQDVADRYDDRGAFTTLLAYEWTGRMYPGPGHKCVYYPERGRPIVSRDDVPDGAELVRRVHAMGGFASPHHIGWTGADEPGHDDVGQPLWEICSCHGCYEHADHPLGQRGELRDQMVDVMLRRGHRFGFTASSDSHGLLFHHGESRKRDPFRTGLTAVQATECSRRAIMEALVARRCYATSGAKILLDVRAHQEPMGSVITGRDEVPCEARVVGTGTIVRVDFVSADGPVSYPCGSRTVTVSGVARSPFTYVRVVQDDGEMAWSSPMFFTNE